MSDTLIYICQKANFKGELHVDRRAWADIIKSITGTPFPLTKFEDLKGQSLFCGVPVIADESVIYAEVCKVNK
jgi:hypothetical protein